MFGHPVESSVRLKVIQCICHPLESSARLKVTQQTIQLGLMAEVE